MNISFTLMALFYVMPVFISRQLLFLVTREMSRRKGFRQQLCAHAEIIILYDGMSVVA
jgi:hypothetical protein